MSKLMTIAAADARAIQDELTAAMTAICTKHGLKLAGNRAAYSANDIRFTIRVATTTDDGVPTAAIAAWARHAPLHHELRDVALGTLVRLRSGRGRITGYDRKRSKFPVMITMESGETMLLAVAGVPKAIADAARA